jgi:predicted dehydrogenase
MSNPIQFGLIGAGQIAWSSADSINDHPHAQVVAAQDLDAGRLEQLCEKHRIPRRHETAEDLFADDAVDAVYIAVPNKFHAPLAKLALEAGKHVILEKPFAMNLAEAHAVVDTAERMKRVFTVGMNMRFRKDSQKVSELVRGGRLGEVYHGKAWWFRRQGIPKLGTWFGNRELAGGGCLYDIGVHLLDLCLFAMNNFAPVSVSGVCYTKFGNRGLGEGGWGHSEREHSGFDVEDFSSALIRFADGATVTLDVSWACHAAEANRNDVALYGTEAGATCFPARLFHGDPQTREYRIIDNPQAAIPFSPDRFHNFINHLRGEEELCVKPEQALVVQQILDAIAESNATGREVRLTED